MAANRGIEGTGGGALNVREGSFAERTVELEIVSKWRAAAHIICTEDHRPFGAKIPCLPSPDFKDFC